MASWGALSALVVIAGLLCGLAGAAMYAYLHKDLTLVVAGQTTKTYTFKRTVGEVLGESGIILDQAGEVSPGSTSYLQTGQTITVRRAVPVTIVIDGGLVVGWSAAPTIGETLERFGIPLGPHDQVTPALQSPLVPGAHVVVTQPVIRTVSQLIAIPNQVKSSLDASLPRGVVRVLHEGRAGLRNGGTDLPRPTGRS